MKQLILWEVHIYPLGKKEFYPLGKCILSFGKKALSSGKWHIILWESCIISSGKRTWLSSGKWNIILWGRKLIPSGKSTSGNWKITKSMYANISKYKQNKKESSNKIKITFREISSYTVKDLFDAEPNMGGKSDIIRYEVSLLSFSS